MTAKFVLNVSSGVLHKHPANEACNLDDARHRAYFKLERTARLDERYKLKCWRCFPMPKAGR